VAALLSRRRLRPQETPRNAGPEGAVGFLWRDERYPNEQQKQARREQLGHGSHRQLGHGLRKRVPVDPADQKPLRDRLMSAA